MRHWSGALAMAFMLVPFAGGMAQEAAKKPWQASPERGEELAVKLCASCHIVPGAQTQTTVAGIPSLEALAKVETMSTERVRNTLIVPHAPMPDMQLTVKEIADITAYLERLAGGRFGGDAGREQDQPREKPKYPSPS